MRRLFLLLIAASILLVACPQQGQGPTFQANYKVGIAGLEAKFLPSSPPATVFANENFQVSIELDNKGGYDIPPDQAAIGLVTDPNTALTDPTAPYLTFPSEGQPMEGKSSINPDGGTETKTYQMIAKPLSPQSDQQDSIIQAKICYPYNTELSTDVCVDTDIENKLTKKPCKITNPSLNGQGAPVAVTALETNLIPSGGTLKPRFTITIANKGQGQVVQQDIIQSLCEKGSGQPFKLIVHIEDAFLGERQLTCNPRDLVLTTDDKIVCTYTQGIPLNIPPFTTPLVVKLSYGYFQVITKTVTVKK